MHATKEQDDIHENAGLLLPLLLSSGLLIAIYLFLHSFYLNYYPYSDDPALALGWTHGIASWFTVGFRDYPIPYPEWYTPSEDFMRPGSSAYWRVMQLWFGTNYALSFALHYVIQLFAVLVVLLTGRRLGLTSKWLSILAVLVTINPGFLTGNSLLWLSGQNDLPIAVTSVLALYLLYLDQYWLALIPLTIGISFKENALIFPVAACISVFLVTRRKGLSLLLLTPDALWYFVRRLIFVAKPGANYAIPTHPTDVLILALKGFFFWPTGVVADDGLRTLIRSHSIRGREADALFVVFNLALWAALAYVGWKVILSDKSQRDLGGARDRLIPLVIWTLCTLGFQLLGARPYYGAPGYMLALLLFIVILSHRSAPQLRMTARAALAMLSIAFVWNLQSVLTHLDWNPFHPMRELVTALQRNGGPAKTVYVVNSAQSFASPAYIEAFAGVHSHLVTLSEFLGCTYSQRGSTSVAIEGAKILIRSQLPDCATIAFSLVDNSMLIPAFAGTLIRSPYASYNLPDGGIVSRALRDGAPNLVYGKRINVTVTPDDRNNFIVLYYDWQRSKYMCAGPRCRT